MSPDPEHPGALFVRTTRNEYAPTAATLGPWGPETLHGGPVAGLLAHGVLAAAAVDEDTRLARLTVDMPRAVPAATLTLHADVRRQGRRVVSVDAEVHAGGRHVARASGLLLRPGTEPDPPLRHEATTISPLAEAVDANLPAKPLHHANCIELRRAKHGAYWVRMSLPIVAGEATHPAERAAVVSDWANPAGNFSGSTIGFINPDITLCLHRPPVGVWLGVGPAARLGSDGIAISDCPLTDSAGVVGRCVAAGLAAGYETKAPGR